MTKEMAVYDGGPPRTCPCGCQEVGPPPPSPLRQMVERWRASALALRKATDLETNQQNYAAGKATAKAWESRAAELENLLDELEAA